jgi:hypothetical protein
MWYRVHIEGRPVAELEAELATVLHPRQRPRPAVAAVTERAS